MSMDSSYETRILEEKTEKLSFRIILVSVLITVLLFGVGFFAYIDLKKDLEELNAAKKNDIDNVSKIIEDKIFKISSRAEGLDSRLSDYEESLKKAEGLIGNVKKEYTKKFTDIRDEVEKSIKKDINKIFDNKKRIKTLSNLVNKNSANTKKAASNIKKVEKESKNLLSQVKGINAELKLINENLDQQESMDNKSINELKSINNKIIAIDKLLNSKSNNAQIDELNKNIDALFKEIKKREVETRILKDKVVNLEKKLNSKKGQAKQTTNVNQFIEQDIQP